MKIQLKFFLVLIVFSLAPLFLVTFIIQHGNEKLGEEISLDAYETLSGITYNSLQVSAENAAKTILHSKTAIEFALLGLVCEAEQAFNKPVPPDIPKIYFSSDYDNPERAPIDFKPIPRYVKRTPDGSIVQSSVSYEKPVFLTAPDVERNIVSKDMAKLSSLDQVFKILFQRLDQMPYWAYVSTESGVHMSYPGHGGYPSTYDPRKRPWYIAGKESMGPADMPVWSVPIIDATTGLVVFTASKRIKYPDGSIAGVAGLDVLLTDVLQESDLTPAWSSQMNSMVVLLTNNSETEEPGLMILAKKEYQKKVASWAGTIKYEWLSPDIREKKEAFIKHISTYRSGYMELPYNDVDSIWAHSHIAENIYFIMVVPKSIIMSLPNKMKAEILGYIKKQHIITGVAAIIVILLISLAAFFGSRALTKSFVQIASAAERLAKGDFSVHLDMKTGDERDLVVRAFNEMVPKLEDHLRLRKALDLAQEVQQSLLPRIVPSIPGLDLAASSIYCDETGGDYYDYFNLCPEDNKKFAFAITVGDVSGHGISSALLMATARALLRQRASMSGQANHIITDVNRNLAIDTQETGQFMTLFYSEFEAKERIIRWVRAGHDPAILYDPINDRFDELKGKGIALGIDESYQYGQYERIIEPHQIIVIGTDGIWEMRGMDGEMFGKESLLRIIREHSSETAQEILSAITEAVHSFRGDCEPEDDITMIIVKAVE